MSVQRVTMCRRSQRYRAVRWLTWRTGSCHQTEDYMEEMSSDVRRRLLNEPMLT